MLSSKENRQVFVFTVILIFFIIISFVGGFFMHQALTKGQGFALLQQAFQILSDNGYKELPQTTQLEYGMINGMLQVYDDPYTILLQPAQNELQSDQLAGKFGGIGVRMEKDTAGNVIIYPIPGSPAQKAGIQEGDFLQSVDNLQVTKDTSMEDIQAAIRGPVGEKVNIVVLKAPQYSTQKSFDVQREEVPLPSVTWNFAPDYPKVGVIQVNIIAATTPDEVTNAIKDLFARGAGYFVLDLRNNSGGLLEEGFDTASLFLPKGAVLDQQYRGKPLKALQSSKDGPFTGIPLTVLVNHNSASSAEIISGMLQINGRAVLVGSPTYGKYSIQLVFDLKDGSSLHVTAAHWWIPGLETSTAGQSLQPDISVPEEQSNQPSTLETAIQALLSQ